MKPNTASFGFQDIDPGEKTKRVQDVFHRVASSYDLMNDVMSGGIHRLWKREFTSLIPTKDAISVLDVAGGTGDIANRILTKNPKAKVTLLDYNIDMLRTGRGRNSPQGSRIQWLCGDAASLPIPDASFDYYTISFGLRNVTDIAAALREAYRVLKPGGRFLCLEFSRVALPLLDEIYEKYSFNVIPFMGHMVAGDRDAYRYLVESISRFPKQKDLKAMLEDVGFSHAGFENLSGGIAAIHSGWRV